ncbi:nucleolin isoform X2 [Stigmatopora argus]
MVKLAKTPNKQGSQKKKAPPPPKEMDEQSSEEEEILTQKVVKKATPARGAKVNAKNGKAAKKAESEDEGDDYESEEEAPAPKKTPTRAAAKAAPATTEESDEDDDDDDDDDDDEESEEEAPPPKKGAKAAAKKLKTKPAKEPSDDDDEESEEAPTPQKGAKQAAKGKPAKQQEEDEDDEDDEEEDESEEEMDTTPAKVKKAGMVKAKEESEDDDDDEEEEDDEEDDEEEDEEAPVGAAKRKAETKGTPPAKRAKSDGDGFCLFAGNLNFTKDYDEIKSSVKSFFTKNEIAVVEVRLGASKKFGYVEFESEEDMLKGLELQGKKVMGFEIKLDKARSKEFSQDDKKERDARTLFVKNIPFSMTADELKEYFEDAVDARVPLGPNGSGRGIGYLEFKSEAEAEKILEASQGLDIQGRSILLDFVGEKSHKGPIKTSDGKVLLVNNLSFNATEESLQAAFEKALSIRMPQREGRPKGFAFVTFETTEDAKEALETLNNTELEGRTIRIEYSQSSRQDGPTKTLFVKGLTEDTTDQTLRDAFEGAVGSRVVTDRETGSSKGFGFVDFDNEDDCKAAKEAMEDGEIDGSKVTLEYAKPKSEGGFRGGRGGGGYGGGYGGGFGGRGGGGFGGRGGGRGGRGGFGRGGGGFGGRGRGGPRGGRGGPRGGFGGGRGGFGGKPQGKRIKFDD